MISNVSENVKNFSLPESKLTAKSPVVSKFNKLSKNQAYYAKKGEPIYQKDMDYDEDGVVTLDEFQKYCKENNADVEQLLKNWLVYHASKDVEETSKEIAEEEDKQTEDSEITYAKKGDSKYQSVMDSNDDGKITYKEYLEYCKQYAKEEKKTSKAEIESSENGLKIKNSDLAVEEYSKTEPPEGKIQTEA